MSAKVAVARALMPVVLTDVLGEYVGLVTFRQAMIGYDLHVFLAHLLVAFRGLRGFHFFIPFI